MMPLLGPWILMCLIITNAFRGDNVTNVLHPLRAVSIENFGQLVASNSLGYSDMKGVNIPYPSFMMEYDYLLFNYHAYQTSFLSSFISDERHKYLGAKLRLSSIDARGQLLTLTEPLIKGRVFLGWSDKLKETLSMAKSRFPRLVWHMGKEHLARTAYGLEPRHVSNPVLLSRIDGLYQSGITEKWIWYKENSGRVNEYNATDRMESNLVKALNLEENMSDFFIYLVYLLSISGIFFLLEFIPITVYKCRGKVVILYKKLMGWIKIVKNIRHSRIRNILLTLKRSCREKRDRGPHRRWRRRRV